jgi:hypothetical protein
MMCVHIDILLDHNMGAYNNINNNSYCNLQKLFFEYQS